MAKKAKAKTKAPVEAEVVDSTPTPYHIAAPDATTVDHTQVAPEPSATMALSFAGGISTADLKQALDIQTEQRALVKEFILKNLTDGTDYGRIHVLSKDKCPDQARCTKDYHFSKRVLFKPGQEKLFSLFQITATLERDEETYLMLHDVNGLVAYKCIMYRGATVVGEGRGSATVGDKGRDTNSTIKIAEKRARMDACLSLGFSEYFAQDLDDPDYKSGAEMANQRVAAEAEARDRDEFGLFPRNPMEQMSRNEWDVLHKMLLSSGFSDKDEITALFEINGINLKEATSAQAREMMGKLKAATFVVPVMADKPEPDVVVDIDGQDPSQAIEEAADAITEVADMDIIVDEDLKYFVTTTFNKLGLSSWGERWLFTKICGRPFAKWEKLADHEWIKAYDIMMLIEDGSFVIPPEYQADLKKGQK